MNSLRLRNELIIITRERKNEMKNIKYKAFLISVITLLILSACGSADVSSLPSQPSVSADKAYGIGGGEIQPDLQGVSPSPSNESQNYVQNPVVNPSGQTDRLVIRNIDLSIVVKDPQVKSDAIIGLATKYGGFVVSSNIYETNSQSGSKILQGTIMIRVPAEKLNDAIKEIKADVVEVTSEVSSGQDVTQQYTDLNSQLKNLESAEKQLSIIMERAEKTEDVMMVFNQLTQIRGQIESIKGQMQYFQQASALSSVSINLVAEETVTPIEIGRWKPEGIVLEAVQNLIDFMKFFFEIIVNLVIVFLPSAILILLVLFGVWQLLKFIFNLLRGKKSYRKTIVPVPTDIPQNKE